MPTPQPNHDHNYVLRNLMSMNFHKILERQIRKTFGEKASIEKKYQELLAIVSKTYDGFDEDRLLIERSLEISSKELNTINNQLKKEKERLFTTLNSIGDGAFTIDTKRHVTFLNKTALELFLPLKKEDILGQNYNKVFKFVLNKDGSANDAFIEKALNENRVTYMQNHTVLILNDKSQIHVANSASPIHSPEGEIVGCIVVFKDVTREYEINKVKSEFISLASHQLRTPLTAIKWSLETEMDGDIGKLNNKQREFMLDAYEASLHMTDLINSLLNISRIETDKLTVRPKKTDLIDLGSKIITELKPVSQEKKQTVKFIKKMNASQIKTDPQLLKEIIGNLLSNAIKYTPEKGKIELTIAAEGEKISIEIKDNGMGIPKSEQKRIFEKFFRASNITHLDTEGTGLGLYISFRLTKLIGGDIQFKSKENQGTTFKLSIPKKGIQAKPGEKGLA